MANRTIDRKVVVSTTMHPDDAATLDKYAAREGKRLAKLLRIFIHEGMRTRRLSVIEEND